MKRISVAAITAASLTAVLAANPTTATATPTGHTAPAAMTRTPPAGTSSLTAPTNLHVVSVTASDILLQWDPSTDHNASYQVYFDNNQTPLTDGQAGTQYDVQFNRAVGLIPGSTHTFFVRAYDGSQTADSSTVTGTFTPGDNTPPTTPTNLHVVSQNANGATVAWDPSTDESAITYFVDGTPCGPLQVDGTQAVIPSAAADPVCGVSSATISVRARDAWDNDSQSSNAVTIQF